MLRRLAEFPRPTRKRDGFRFVRAEVEYWIAITRPARLTQFDVALPAHTRNWLARKLGYGRGFEVDAWFASASYVIPFGSLGIVATKLATFHLFRSGILSKPAIPEYR